VAIYVEEDPGNLGSLASAAMPNAQEQTENCRWSVEDTFDDGEDVAAGEGHGASEVFSGTLRAKTIVLRTAYGCVGSKVIHFH
jgi:hypothetical protein